MDSKNDAKNDSVDGKHLMRFRFQIYPDLVNRISVSKTI